MNDLKIIRNGETVALNEIPVFQYATFCEIVGNLLNNSANHCVNYFAVPISNKLMFYCLIAQDQTHDIALFAHELMANDTNPLEAISAKYYAMHVFEREIHEQFGVNFIGHPWLKPLRYAYNRADLSQIPENYPFYKIEGDELHQVGVGPIHAGIIEPGHFHFICQGERVLHLEIQLGYQHRGIEPLFPLKKQLLQQTILAENIAGDTAIGHTLAFTTCMESLSNIGIDERLSIERTIAIELERIAMHISDTCGLCTDIAYQFGQVVNEALRTMVINTTQLWCGNRFGKGLIRTGGSHYPISPELAGQMLQTLTEVEQRFQQISDRIFSLPSILDRFEEVGTLTQKQAELIGAVGLTARSARVRRDIRCSHPFVFYVHEQHHPLLLKNGDVCARAMLRSMEIKQSFSLVKAMLNKLLTMETTENQPVYDAKLRKNSFSVSLVEGWRGEICHCALTGDQGQVKHYKIKDPSFHNWMALALVLRKQAISDFPICNKSFDLSYCGNDL